ncbi:rRNA-processing protein UTP23 homolog [Prorops nasuta]|uniref:rRNA-processing protein UTP23 homolog n=1 Tax=Prorops nasuta TaxID=863751 RepID=UPI0034CE83A9
MKTSRNKKAKKNLAFFINNFQFRIPFQILIDGTFAVAALENKFNIRDQLTKYIQAEVKLLTTPCVIQEGENLCNFSNALIGATKIIKQFAVHKCGHDKKPVVGAECLKSMVADNNLSRYIIATQDRELQDVMRNIPGVPLLYLHGKAPTLESPSTASQEYACNMQKNLGMTTWDQKNIEILKKQTGLIQSNEKTPRKKKVKGGPNPLSCLKKKKKNKPNISSQSKKLKDVSKAVKRTKKIKMAPHIREALMNEIKQKLNTRCVKP